MNAAVFDHTEYNPLAPDSDPGTNVYRLVRHTAQKSEWGYGPAGGARGCTGVTRAAGVEKSWRGAVRGDHAANGIPACCVRAM